MAYEEIASLVKFCPAETGLHILRQGTLPFVAPADLQDPFQPDHLCQKSFTREALLKALIRQVVVLIFAQKSPEPPYNTLTRAICRWRDEERFDIEEEAEEVLSDLLEQMVEQHEEGITKLYEQWREFASRIRICTFTAKPDSLRGWERNAKNHTGIALRFRCGNDTSLESPRLVSYQNSPPSVTSLKEELHTFFSIDDNEIDPDSFYERLLVQRKSRRDEREWRCFTQAANDSLNEDTKNNAVDIPSDDSLNGIDISAEKTIQTQQEPAQSNGIIHLTPTSLGFADNELTGVYLGLHASQETEDQVKSVIESKFPNSKLYRATMQNTQYELDFEVVSLR